MTICLGMIVKNEAHILPTTLENICKYIKLDYWVISDTGSTDATKELIYQFFNDRKIPGELIQHPWVDFSTNRNHVIQHAQQKADYMLMFDADDSFVGDLVLPPVLTEDAYLLTFGQGLTYTRPTLFSLKKSWKYVGVLHESLESADSTTRRAFLVEGKYHVVSGRTGNRNKNPRKYQDDAELLEKAILTETDEALKNRYIYYCAQSYRDFQDKENAYRMYKIFLDTNGSSMEKYNSCIELARLCFDLNKAEEAQTFLCRTIAYDSERIEGIIMLMERLHTQKNHLLINALYHKCKGYNRRQSHKTFYMPELYDYVLEAFNSVSAPQVGDPASGYECCKKVIMYSKNKTNVSTCLNNLPAFKAFLDKDPAFKAYMETNFKQ
jgi:glycosyltransferase involved in cell wall biosynthesis